MYLIQYTGDGSTTEFDFAFPFFKAADVKVSINSEILKISEYTVVFSKNLQSDGMYPGGKIVLNTAPVSGATIRIWRKIDLSRVIDYQPTLPIQTESLNADFNFMLEFMKDIYELDGDIANIENAVQFVDSIQEQIDNLGGLDELARKDEIPDVSNFVKKDEFPDISDFVTKDEIPDTSDFATKDEIPDTSNFALANHTHDMSLYATKSEVSSALAEKQNLLTNVQLQATNSGITSTKVATYDAYANQISGKISIQQGSENAGKFLQVGIDGNIITSAMASSGAEGLLAVSHDESLSGAGTNALPLSVSNIEKLSNKITNCIVQKPQKVKMTLENGVLTLKAGSVVYVPNGVGVFTETVLQSDKTLTVQNFGESQGLLVYNPSSDDYFPFEREWSGNTVPTGLTGNTHIWYDTANNQIKYTNNAGSTWNVYNISLPIAIVSMNSAGTVISIDQIFNCVGFMGITAFTLPGLQVLAPNGINSDGSLKNSMNVQNEVKVYTFPDFSRQELWANASGLVAVDVGIYKYDEESNFIKYIPDGTNRSYAKIADIGNDGTRINSINQANAFRVIDLKTIQDAVENKQDKLTAGENINISDGVISATSFLKTDLSNLSTNCDYVVASQLPTEDNSYTWYRMYKSGWVEQGGYIMPPTSPENTVSLPIPMSDSHYTIVQGFYGKTSASGYDTGYNNQTETSFVFVCRYAGVSGSNYGYWFVSGKAA